MNKVDAIRDVYKIEEFSKRLKERDYKYYIMALIGFNTGFRISDILPLRVRDVRNGSHIQVIEQKTGKGRKAFINDNLRVQLNKYIEEKGLNSDDYLIYANTKNKDKSERHIKRVQAYTVLKEESRKCGIENVGTHTLRKTFGYHHYQIHKDIATLQEIFNHSHPNITRRYIGINQDLMDDSVKNFTLGAL